MGSRRATARALRVGFALFALFALTGARLVVGAAPAAAAGGTYIVNDVGDEPDVNTGDPLCRTATGTCTLRAALNQSNSDGGASLVQFAIPGPGPHTIQVNGGLPFLFDGSGPTTVDGYSQPGAVRNGDALVSRADLRIQIRGDGTSAGADADGFSIGSANNVIDGLALFNMRKPVNLTGAGARGNVVIGSFLGTDIAGTFSVGTRDEQAAGVVMEGGASGNRIGGPSPQERNVISGNSSKAVYLSGGGTDGNVIENNLIGLAPTGDRRLANGGHGVDINSGASDTVARGNVLSGNMGSGLEASHPYQGTTGTQVVNNVVGLDPSGNSAPAYATNGQSPDHPNLRVEDGPLDTYLAGNVVGNSVYGGIRIDSCLPCEGGHAPTARTTVENNLVGITRTGAPASNGPYGVLISAGTIETRLGPNNVIAFNGGPGVSVTGATTDRNTITRNSIHDNGGLGIDIEPGGVSNDDPGDGDSGANDQLNRPVISSTTSTSVSGTACGRCVVEVFVTDGGGDAAGEGRTFLGSATADDAGAFSVPVPSSGTARTVTATATDGAGNTSEFSSNIALSTGPIASDAFQRQVSGGWGTADAGGPWSTGGALESTSFSVDGSAGSVTLPTAPTTREATLAETSELDVDVTATVWTNRRATGGDGLVASLEARRQSDTLAYRARLRLAPDGSVHLGVEAGGVLVGSEVTVPGVVHDPDTRLRLRFRARGASPTNLDAKVWLASQPEPGGWNLQVQDLTPSLQAAGPLGILVSSAEPLLAPSVTFSFDDYSVQSPSGK